MASLVMPSGDTVEYKAYEGILYVTNVEDSTYQTLNIYVPTDLKGRKDSEIPVIMRQYVGGYMASTAKSPSATDASGRALQEGYVVCIPGARGSNSVVERDGKKVYTGIAPNGLLDLKAAVRYLRYNDSRIPGNSERIFIDGTSAGGAMSALIGATGNNKEYGPYLEAMGAAKAKDNVYGAICYCPITDLNHADMEYEWLYNCTN
ncbi:MAG: carboxylesterase family protein, partial [Duncaniella sp.]|nr:carboxylesterase family protein [Duncaniella sp.]